MALNEKNYYEILEAPLEADSDQIYKCYLKAKNAYSPDSLAMYSLLSKEECESMLNQIDEAYSIISDPQKRRAYDTARGITRSTSPEDPFILKDASAPMAAAPIEKYSAVHQPVVKIMAHKRFTLKHQVDTSFEKEIEQVTEFNGSILKKIREYKNVDIPRMSDMTKVSKTYLRNIEDEKMQGLPALVYVRGFVYQYAKCLKLNPDLVATSYLKHIRQKMDQCDQ